VALCGLGCALPLDYVDGGCGVVSLRVALALCGLGCALPLDSVDGMVPWFGVNSSGLSITPAAFSVLIYASCRLVMLLPAWVLIGLLPCGGSARQATVWASQSHLPLSLFVCWCVLFLFLLPFSFPL
jgi:hypothetical protein